jgi:hypothetical protein
MRVHTTEAAKSSRSNTNAFEVRQLDTTVVPNHHVLNVTLAVNESADLPSCIVGKKG